MKKTRRTRTIFLIIVLAMTLIGCGFLYYKNSLTPIQKTPEDFTLVIEKGDTAKGVTEFLEGHQVIRNATTAYIHIKMEGLTQIKVGTYHLDKSWDVDRIFMLLNDPTGAINTDIKVTLPEGIWAKDIALRIAKETKVSADELLNLWNDEDYITEIMEKYPFLTDAVLNNKLHVKLEGYLFPDTYYFYSNSTVRQITEKILDRTYDVYKKYLKEFNESEYTIHEIFTLASMTQFESNTPKDDKIISGVWFNRLKIGMKLQASATVCYALYDFDHWRACETNPNYDSPYNTYKYAGIPIGPIDNPGEAAIASIFYPTVTDYYYFVADVYGDGKIHYAKTYAEHQANINKYYK